VVSLDSITLDQLRLFVAVAEDGSFSATGRRLNRAQSAVSYGIANLEKHLEVTVFRRSGRSPTLTAEGKALLPRAREVLAAARGLGVAANSFSEGLEPEVIVAISVLCPPGLLVSLGRAFQERFPTVALRIRTEVLDAVPRLVLEGQADLGISEPAGLEDARLDSRFLTSTDMVPVVSADHSLARTERPITKQALKSAVQIVIAQGVQGADTATAHVYSETTWRVPDGATKFALIRAGLGWGFLPLERVGPHLGRGKVIQLDLADRGPTPLCVPLSLVTRVDAARGPAVRWILQELGSLVAGADVEEKSG